MDQHGARWQHIPYTRLDDDGVKLMKRDWKRARPCHLSNRDGHYVIVLQDQRIIVETQQHDTQPCTYVPALSP